MYHQIEGGPSIVCVNRSFAVGFLKTLRVPWTSPLWRHLWFMIIPWLRGTTTFSNKQWHIISSCFLGKSKQYSLAEQPISSECGIRFGITWDYHPGAVFFFKYRSPRTKKYDLVGGWPTPLKKMSSWVGILIPNIYGNIKHVPNHNPVIHSSWIKVIGSHF
jgi:hypothetical protein